MLFCVVLCCVVLFGFVLCCVVLCYYGCSVHCTLKVYAVFKQVSNFSVELSAIVSLSPTELEAAVQLSSNV